MNLAAIRSGARRKLNIAEVNSILSNTQLNTDINEAYYQVALKLVQKNEDFFEEQKTLFNLGLNSGLYSAPTDCIKIKQIRLAYSTPNSEDDYKVAVEYDPSQVEDVQTQEIDATTSNPIVDITNNYFRIYPKPTSAITSGGEIYYIARPSAMADNTATPILPVEYHQLLAIYPAKEAAFKFGLDKYAELKNEWEIGLLKVGSDFQPRNINRAERMRNILETGRKQTNTELW